MTGQGVASAAARGVDQGCEEREATGVCDTSDAGDAVEDSDGSLSDGCGATLGSIREQGGVRRRAVDGLLVFCPRVRMRLESAVGMCYVAADTDAVLPSWRGRRHVGSHVRTWLSSRRSA